MLPVKGTTKKGPLIYVYIYIPGPPKWPKQWTLYCLYSLLWDVGPLFWALMEVQEDVNRDIDGSFPKLGALFGSPYNGDHSVLGSIFGPPVYVNPQIKI